VIVTTTSVTGDIVGAEGYIFRVAEATQGRKKWENEKKRYYEIKKVGFFFAE
jgi:hypothetical protein